MKELIIKIKKTNPEQHEKFNAGLTGNIEESFIIGFPNDRAIIANSQTGIRSIINAYKETLKTQDEL